MTPELTCTTCGKPAFPHPYRHPITTTPKPEHPPAGPSGTSPRPDPVRAVQITATLDLWMALGLPIADFDGYLARNRYATTWAGLLARVRTLAQGESQCTRNDWCVLVTPHIGPCYALDDVGRAEPLPDTPTPNGQTHHKPPIDVRTSAVGGGADG